MQIDAIITMALLAIVVRFLAGPYQSLCVDFARQVLFGYRDRLFDLAAAGKLSFESPEYREARLHIERHIRFAHRMHLTEFLTFDVLRVRKKGSRTQRSRARSLLPNIKDSGVRSEVNAIVDKSTVVLLVLMAVRSPFLPILILIGIVASLWSSTGAREKFLGRVKRDVEAEAIIAA